MLLIKKGRAPGSLIKYLKTPESAHPCYADVYRNRTDIIRDIQEALLRDQGHLCAYCMRRISKEDMTIEHLKPQSLYPNDTLDYVHNLLGVCHKNSRSFGDTTCDAKKANAPLTLDPADERHIGSIFYDMKTGDICSRIPAIQEDIEKRLNLNSVKQSLPQSRLRAYNGMMKALDKKRKKGTWSRAVLEDFLRDYSTPDSDGKLRRYAGVVIWYIKERMQSKYYS